MLQIFTVYDSKAEAYLQPFYSRSKGESLRSFHEACNDPNHAFFKHAGDFTLFHLGEWNELEGKFVSLSAPVSMGCAIEFKALGADARIRTAQEPFELLKDAAS